MPESAALQVRVDASVGALVLQTSFTLASPWAAIFGPSGSGKSSLLRLIAGLWTPAGAEVLLDGLSLAKLPPHKRRIAMVAQQSALFPHRTVRQNIAFGALSTNEPAEWTNDLIANFGLTTHADASPATLSGGEGQRVAIARALASKPRYLLLDEVFTGMHQSQQDELIGKLRDYGDRLGMGIVSVTHDVAEAMVSATEVLKLDNGRVTAQGLPSSVLAAERQALLRQLGTNAERQPIRADGTG